MFSTPVYDQIHGWSPGLMMGGMGPSVMGQDPNGQGHGGHGRHDQGGQGGQADQSKPTNDDNSNEN